MNLTAIIRIKEKIAVSSDFTPKERDFILEAINAGIEAQRAKNISGVRDATEDERSALELRTCPDCGSLDFRPGPRGGAAQNIECRSCGARFNVTVYGAKLVFAQRIPSEVNGGGVWREDLFPK